MGSGSGAESHCDAEGRRCWEVGARAAEGGMLSCFNLCQWPPPYGGDQSSGPSVLLSSSLMLLSGAAGSPARPEVLSVLYPSPQALSECPPPTAGRFKEREQLLVKLPVFTWCEFRCSMRDLLCLFPSPQALTVSPGQSL